jgi:hypothetical protein
VRVRACAQKSQIFDRIGKTPQQDRVGKDKTLKKKKKTIFTKSMTVHSKKKKI